MNSSATRKRQGAENAKVDAFCAFQKTQITKSADELLVSSLICQAQIFFKTLEIKFWLSWQVLAGADFKISKVY